MNWSPYRKQRSHGANHGGGEEGRQRVTGTMQWNSVQVMRGGDGRKAASGVLRTDLRMDNEDSKNMYATSQIQFYVVFGSELKRRSIMYFKMYRGNTNSTILGNNNVYRSTKK